VRMEDKTRRPIRPNKSEEDNPHSEESHEETEFFRRIVSGTSEECHRRVKGKPEESQENRRQAGGESDESRMRVGLYGVET